MAVLRGVADIGNMTGLTAGGTMAKGRMPKIPEQEAPTMADVARHAGIPTVRRGAPS
jgi:hypothetical protein